MMNRSLRQKRTFCAPTGAASDTFLRPRSGNGYAPRQVATCLAGESVWLSWVHHYGGEDSLVVTRKDSRYNGKLVNLAAEKQLTFSKPAFLKKAEAPPELFCAIGKRGVICIHQYVLDNGKWRCKATMPTQCQALYHMDLIASSRGDVFLVYSGSTGNRYGLQVYSRSCRRGQWHEEQLHLFKGGSVNRPKLAVDEEGHTMMVADGYHNSKYDVFWKRLRKGRSESWQRISQCDGWNLFPSITTDSQGSLWVSWLRQVPVRREDVMGLRQEAWMARFLSGEWKPVPGTNGGAAANLSFGLLPIKRYFGYNGLRRYPRLMATDDNAIWLLWEQQKDEEENWKNVDNGFFCGQKYLDNRWSKPVVLSDRGTCHTFDEKVLYRPDRLIIAFKSCHKKSGNDFGVIEVDGTKAAPYHLKPLHLWKGWKPQRLPLRTRNKKRSSEDMSVKKGHSLFWGDLHCHSYFSPDAEGEPDEMYFFARDLAGLDFAAITDNDFYPDKVLLNSEVSYLAHLADNLTKRDKFVCFSGYEWTFHRRVPDRSTNHRILIFMRDFVNIVRRNEENGMSEKAFKKYIEENDHLVFPHHAYWKLLETPSECTVEVTSGWGTYILDAPTVQDALSAGHKLGFLGNGDTHRFMPGLSGALTGVYAKELSREAIIEAITKRRCFATTGNRTAVAFWINDSCMGEQLGARESPTLRWHIQPQTDMEKVEVIRNGRIVHRSGLSSGIWVDERVRPGQYYYYLQVKEQGRHKRYPHNIAPAWGKYAWTSPIWVNIQE